MMCKDGTDRHSSNDDAARESRDGRHLPAHPGHAAGRRAGATAGKALTGLHAAGLDVFVEPVDNWHKDWPMVLQAIDRLGQRNALHVDAQGWLSARQVLLVAFDPASKRVAGHLCFRLAPAADDNGEVMVEAQFDAMGVQPGFESVRVQVAATLRAAAERRAKDLKCQRLVGFDA